MAIIRSGRKSNFTVIDNQVFEDNCLTFEAQGLLCKILSKPDNWNISVEHLVKTTANTRKQSGSKAIYSILNELIEKGFVIRKKNQNGTVDYTVFDTPQNAKTANSPKGKQPKPQTAETANSPKGDTNKYGNKEITNTEYTPLPPNEAQNKTDDGLQPFASDESLACENVGLVDKKSEAVAGVPAQEILSAYNEILGDVLPKAQLLNKSRQRAIKARWAEVLNTTDPSGNVRYFDRQTGIEWWKRFFAKVKLNPHWVGANDLGWRADLDWICKPTNFLKVLEWRPVKN